MISRTRALTPALKALNAVALGLPAALLAHALVFGGEHAVGGALQSAALAAGSLILLASVALSARATAQGSIAAARVRNWAPGALPVLVTAAAWFALLEACEAPHAVALFIVAAALCAASIAVRFAVAVFARWLAAIAIAVVAFLVSAAAFAAPHFVRTHTSPRARRTLAHAARLFSRPPPAFS